MTDNSQQDTLDAREKRIQQIALEMEETQRTNEVDREMCQEILAEAKKHYARSRFAAILAIFFFSIICAKSVLELYQIYQTTGTS